METKQELLHKPTEELIKIILDLQHMVIDLREENRQLKDELANSKKSRPSRR